MTACDANIISDGCERIESHNPSFDSASALTGGSELVAILTRLETFESIILDILISLINTSRHFEASLDIAQVNVDHVVAALNSNVVHGSVGRSRHAIRAGPLVHALRQHRRYHVSGRER